MSRATSYCRLRISRLGAIVGVGRVAQSDRWKRGGRTRGGRSSSAPPSFDLWRSLATLPHPCRRRRATAHLHLSSHMLSTGARPLSGASTHHVHQTCLPIYDRLTLYSLRRSTSSSGFLVFLVFSANDLPSSLSWQTARAFPLLLSKN